MSHEIVLLDRKGVRVSNINVQFGRNSSTPIRNIGTVRKQSNFRPVIVATITIIVLIFIHFQFLANSSTDPLFHNTLFLQILDLAPFFAIGLILLFIVGFFVFGKPYSVKLKDGGEFIFYNDGSKKFIADIYDAINEAMRLNPK